MAAFYTVCYIRFDSSWGGGGGDNYCNYCPRNWNLLYCVTIYKGWEKYNIYYTCVHIFPLRTCCIWSTLHGVTVGILPARPKYPMVGRVCTGIVFYKSIIKPDSYLEMSPDCEAIVFRTYPLVGSGYYDTFLYDRQLFQPPELRIRDGVPMLGSRISDPNPYFWELGNNFFGL